MAGPLNLTQSDLHLLPPFAQELVTLVGFAAAIRLVELHPGIPFYVPETLTDDHWLVAEVGRKLADKLVWQYGGGTITPPNCKNALCKLRHRQIRAQRAAGLSQNEAARQYGMTPRGIRKVESKAPEEDRNGNLF